MLEKIQMEDKKVGFDYMGEAKKFLGNSELFDLVGIDEVNRIIEEVKSIDISTDNQNSDEVSYDKRKKTFKVNGDEVTPGEIVASSNFNHSIAFPENYDTSFEVKRLKGFLLIYLSQQK